MSTPAVPLATRAAGAAETARAVPDRLSPASDAAHMGTFDWDVRSDCFAWSRWHDQLWGFAAGEFDGTWEALAQRVHSDDLPGLRAELTRCMAAHAPFSGEFRVVWADASIHWIAARGEFDFDDHGRAVRMRGAMMETTAHKMAEARLCESEARLEAAQALAHLGNWELDLETMKITYSPEMFRLVRRDPALGAPNSSEFLDLVHPEDRILIEQARARARDTKEPYTVEYRTDPSRGPIRWIQGTVQVFRDAEGRPVRAAGTSLDITDRKKAEEEIERDIAALKEREHELAREKHFSDTMLESMPGVLYFYDEAGHFLRWNRHFEDSSGYSREEVERMHPLDFFSPEEQPRIRERIARVLAEGESSVEGDLRAKDGTLRPYFFTGRRVDFNGARCLVGVGIDISERRRAESALRELNETLETKVVQRTEELRAALVRAEAADHIKSAFLATMSHELRTPLNSIIGFTGILLQGLAGGLNPEQGKQLGMVQASARHLLALINDVLDLSKIEANQLQVRAESFDLRASLDAVLASIRPLAERKGLALTALVSPAIGWIVSDRRRVEQILLNLLGNAVKFTERGGITLRADVVEESRSSAAAPRRVLRLCVSDTGIGVSPENLATLFQPFRQIDTGLTRVHEGTGLGLAICRRLADLLGGDITAASEPAKGSEFTLTLPLPRGTEP